MHLGDNGGNSVMRNQNGASPTSSTGPTRYCDLVMKGGVTSGIVYPAAVAALKDVYTFKNIGGTSAGAMAAAATAAAEFARRNGYRSGFEELERLHKWLAAKAPSGGHSNLFSMFQPDRATRPIYDVLVAGLGPRRLKYTKMIARVLWAFRGFVLLVSVPGLLLLGLSWWFLTSGPPEWRPYGWAVAGLGLLLAAAGALSGAVLGCVWRVNRAFPASGYGLCSGHATLQRRSWLSFGRRTRPVALTDWLTCYLNRLAGLPENGRPLTFGDLWGSGGAADPAIRLEMMATNVTHSRPHRLPDLGKGFWFDGKEMRKLFPEPVVEWMEQHPDRSVKNPESFTKMGLRPMPAPDDLPLVVAARMSLALPIVLSAVPLYTVDYAHARYRRLYNRPDKTIEPERCWFSDGGICSNFPVHFFDTFLPRWPTFAINLRSFHPDDTDHKDEVWMPVDNSRGRLESWNRFETEGGLMACFGFLMACVDSARNWADGTLSRLPGYRDRIVHVALDDETEGGTNLDMPAEVINHLASRGRRAGEELCRRFARSAPDVRLDWDNHRWVRTARPCAAGGDAGGD